LQAAEQLADELGPTKLLVLEYHTSDAYTVTGIQALLLSYGVTGTPTVLFNGANPSIGSNSVVQDDYVGYKNKINYQLTLRSPVAIEASTRIDSDSLLVNVKLTNSSNQTITGAELVGVTYVDQGKSQYRAVVSGIASSDNQVHLSPGETLNLQLNFQKPVSTVQVVVFLKLPGRIIQAALAV
jgi:hypothetical protein